MKRSSSYEKLHEMKKKRPATMPRSVSFERLNEMKKMARTGSHEQLNEMRKMQRAASFERLHPLKRVGSSEKLRTARVNASGTVDEAMMQVPASLTPACELHRSLTPLSRLHCTPHLHELTAPHPSNRCRTCTHHNHTLTQSITTAPTRPSPRRRRSARSTTMRWWS